MKNVCKSLIAIKNSLLTKYEVNLDSYKGLGIINMYIYPHFQKANEEMKNKVSKYEKRE